MRLPLLLLLSCLAVPGVLCATPSDGVEWQGTAQGLWLGKSEYFTLRRYLPDDEVLSVVPDAPAGDAVLTGELDRFKLKQAATRLPDWLGRYPRLLTGE